MPTAETCLPGTNFPVTREFIKTAIEAGISSAEIHRAGMEDLSEADKKALRATAEEIDQVLFGQWVSGDCGCPAVKAGLISHDALASHIPMAVRNFAVGFDAHCSKAIVRDGVQPTPYRLVVEDA